MRRALRVAGLLALVAAPLEAQAVFGVGGELSALKNDTIRVPLFADLAGAGGEKLGSYTLRLAWDPAVLTKPNIVLGSFSEPLSLTDSAPLGVLRIAGVSLNGAAGLLDLAVVEFTVGSEATSVLDLTVTEASAAGTLVNLMPVTVLDGSFCPGRGRWGDLDKDKRANSRDALAILSNNVGLPVDPSFDVTLGDVDGDAAVNSRDALILLSYAVGLDIPGQRVLLVAGGVCTTGVTPTLLAVPDTAHLVPRQYVELVVRGRDAAGKDISLTSLRWMSADSRIAFVTPEGEVQARDTGTTVVTAAVGPGIQIDVPVVVKARRGTWRVDFAVAQTTTVHLGTQKFPLATPQYAFPFVSEGDTIRIAPGVHPYDSIFAVMPEGAVIIGDTLADGTRPVLQGSATPGYRPGLDWGGGVRGEVWNLVFRGFTRAIDAGRLLNLHVENVRIEEPPNDFGEGIYTSWPKDTVRVLRSTLPADASSGYGVYIGSNANYVQIESNTFERWRSGATYVSWANTIVFRSNTISKFNADVTAVQLFGQGSGTVTNNTLDSTDQGFNIVMDTLTVSDNVLTGSRGIAIHVQPTFGSSPGTFQILRNRITCGTTDGGAGPEGIIGFTAPMTIVGNWISGCGTGGIKVTNNTTPIRTLVITDDTVAASTEGIQVHGRWNASLHRNRVTGGSVGLRLQTWDNVTVVADSNLVTGATVGVAVNPTGAPTYTGRKNNISSNFNGLDVSGGVTGTYSFILGRFVGNSNFAVSNGSGITIDVSQNWWGSPSPPVTAPPNGVTGPVNTSSNLTSDPAPATVPN